MKSACVIDDHHASRINLVGLLKQNGYAVIGEASSGSQAVSLTSRTAPDVVLMAVGLPDIDGIQLARKIMEACPCPIVLITGHDDPATVERATRVGVMAYLMKPLRANELRPAIEIAIARFQEFVALQKENENLKKTLEARKTIERAKGILMKTQRLTEAQAFAAIKRKSMDSRKPMVEIARAILLAEEIAKGTS
jgi:response regulator NasT